MIKMTEFVFDKSITVGPLRIIKDCSCYRICNVIHGRDCVDMIYNRHDPYGFLLNNVYILTILRYHLWLIIIVHTLCIISEI